MYISELAIHGFKSFANKERLSFGQGVTAVVGPNGCGKTNIVDAVRWVLGEQKTRMLRSTRLDDIIFNGSDAKKPLSVCEVSLTVHNNRGILPVEYNDVEITRRVFRNGESEYMINRNNCRLRDIHNLFVDTGMGADAYSVMELRMIEHILSENAEDRRRMFEEAAGINKYRHQRRATLLKLESTKGDLDRVNDIISEVDNKVHSLQLQMKRYKRHEQLIETLQGKEINLAALKSHNILNELQPLQKQVDLFSSERSSKLEQEKVREYDLVKLRSMYEDQRSELSLIQTEIDSLSKERQASSNQMLVLSEQRRGTDQTIERLTLEKADGKQKEQAHVQKIEELNQESDSLQPSIELITHEYDSFKKTFDKSEISYNKALNYLDSLSLEQMKHLEELNNSRSLRDRTAEIVDEKIKLLSTLKNRSVENEDRKNKLEAEQKTLISNHKALEALVEDKKNVLAEDEALIAKLQNKKQDITLENYRIMNRVEILESQLQFYREVVEKGEGYSGGTRHVLKHRKEFTYVLGTVADLLLVKEKYRLAVEAALGPVSQSLVCEKREHALDILRQLSGKNLGRVWIVPLDVIPSITRPVGGGSSSGLDASEVVSSESRYKPIIDFFLQGISIVKNAKDAENHIDKDDFSNTVVDLDGNLYSSSGLIMSQDNSRGLSILGRKEKIKLLDREIEKLLKKNEKTRQSIDSIDSQVNNTEKNHELLSSELRVSMDRMMNNENEINRIDYAMSQNLEAEKSTLDEIISAKSGLSNYQKSFDNLTPILKKDEEKLATFQSKLDKAKEQLESTRSMRDTSSQNFQDHRIELVSLEGKLENLQFRIKASSDSITEINNRNKDIDSELKVLHAKIGEIKSEKVIAEKSYNKMSAKLKKTLSVNDLKNDSFRETYRQIEEAERLIRDEQRERETKAEEMKRIELQISDFEGELRRIQDRIKEKYDLKVPGVDKIKSSESDLALEIDRIDRSIERIGPINMAVKEEFDEENNRLGFLQRQHTDLLESEERLLETMDKIDTAARAKFLETFDKIRTNFKKTFTMFFEGGECDLELRGDEDPFEANINILAKPPGKHTRNLRMLSSGEKALTAISLIFAIYLVKPSPFCILDEVDAPLDDNNIGKFTRALEKFAEQTQFIVVTHNKLTMEAAKFLYGVTMAQSGISKIVSVELN